MLRFRQSVSLVTSLPVLKLFNGKNLAVCVVVQSLGYSELMLFLR